MNSPIPPAGKALSFVHWARTVHRRLRDSVGDLHVAGSPMHAEWSKGALRVGIDGAEPTWVVRFDRQGAFVMPPLTISRHDVVTAENVAKTIMGFFDPALSARDR